DAIDSFLERVLEYLEAGECPAGIFYDLSRAFDCIDPQILLDKIDNAGIRGTPQKWIFSYISNRKQYVSIGGMVSQRVHLRHPRTRIWRKKTLTTIYAD